MTRLSCIMGRPQYARERVAAQPAAMIVDGSYRYAFLPVVTANVPHFHVERGA